MDSGPARLAWPGLARARLEFPDLASLGARARLGLGTAWARAQLDRHGLGPASSWDRIKNTRENKQNCTNMIETQDLTLTQQSTGETHRIKCSKTPPLPGQRKSYTNHKTHRHHIAGRAESQLVAFCFLLHSRFCDGQP